MDTKQIVLLAVLHAIAIVVVATLLVVLLRGEPPRRPNDSERRGGDGGQPTRPPPAPRPGCDRLLLRDRRAPRVRLREPAHPGERVRPLGHRERAAARRRRLRGSCQAGGPLTIDRS
jgi:hypothetical protein